MGSIFCSARMTFTTITMLLKTTLITCTSVSTSHNCGIILWVDFLEEARVEVDKLQEYRMVQSCKMDLLRESSKTVVSQGPEYQCDQLLWAGVYSRIWVLE